MSIATISAAEFGKRLATGQATHVVDVRTPAEFGEVHVDGARLAPLDALDPRRVTDALRPAEGAQLFLLCKSGKRATAAAEKFHAAGIANVCVVEGGTEACIAAGLPVKRGEGKAMPLDQQVRLAVGAIILGAWFLARLGVPLVGWIIPFMGAGLVFSGVTGFCGLAIILGKAPWNQCREADSCRIC